MQSKITRVAYFTNKKNIEGYRHSVIVDTRYSVAAKQHALIGVMCDGFLNQILKKARLHKAKIVKLKKENFQIHWL